MRADEAEKRALRKRANLSAARSWALDRGLRVGTSGRLPAAVLQAWKDAGSPVPDTATGLRPSVASIGVPGRANPPGRARVAQAYRYLSTVLRQAVRDGRIGANPCQIPAAGLIRTPERVPATPEEIHALAAAMPPRWAAAVQVAAWSGLRAGELFGLARRHVDLDAGTVRVERAVTYLPGEPPFLGTTKTESSRRTVHLPPHVVTLLADHIKRYTRPGPDALVFADERGPIAPANLRQRSFRRARNAIGRPRSHLARPATHRRHHRGPGRRQPPRATAPARPLGRPGRDDLPARRLPTRPRARPDHESARRPTDSQRNPHQGLRSQPMTRQVS